jgi:hypothetical protein
MTEIVLVPGTPGWEENLATIKDRLSPAVLRVASLLWSIERFGVARDNIHADSIAPIYLELADNLRNGDMRRALIAALQNVGPSQ